MRIFAISLLTTALSIGSGSASAGPEQSGKTSPPSEAGPVKTPDSGPKPAKTPSRPAGSAKKATDSPELAKYRLELSTTIENAAADMLPKMLAYHFKDIEVPAFLVKHFTEYTMELEFGEGNGEVIKDSTKSLKELGGMAHRGSVTDQLLMAKLIDKHHLEENALEFPSSTARKMQAIGLGYYRKAAEQGNLEAAFRLGLHYHLGIGVERSMPDASRYYLMSKDPRAKLLSALTLLSGLGLVKK